MAVTCQPFGKLANGQAVEQWILTDDRLRACVLTYGAALQSLCFDGVEVALGFDTIEDYQAARCPYIGMIVGRYANRLPRELEVSGKTYALACNEGDAVQLHGGEDGLHRRLWKAEAAPGPYPGVTLTTCCAHMQAGCPGEMTIRVTYTLRPGPALGIDYEATCDQDTVVNLTNHAFFNLNGVGKEDIRNHRVKLCASRYLPVDSQLLPLGEPCPVEGTPFDFMAEDTDETSSIGSRLGCEHPQIALAGGIDHNFCIDGEGLRLAARVSSPVTGIAVECISDQPGLQIYVGQGLNEAAGAGGHPIGLFGGFCLETQHYPDSPRHPEYPTTFLPAGEMFRSHTEYRFFQQERGEKK